MAEINLTIHGKVYGVACDDGQERRVAEVGRYVDGRARDIAAAGAANNENHLLVLTALVLADEVKDLHDNILWMQNSNNAAKAQPKPVYSGLSEPEERSIVLSIEKLAHRIESVADRLTSN